MPAFVRQYGGQIGARFLAEDIFQLCGLGVIPGQRVPPIRRASGGVRVREGRWTCEP